jgi:hypothetical protein
MRQIRLALWFPVVLLIAAFQTVPAELCQQVIRTAMAATNSICNGLGRNEACYGNRILEATPQPGIPNFKFDNPGDIIDITGLESLRLSAMDMDNDLWGIALMRMQANIPNRMQTQNVTMVLFGDVEVRNQVRNPHLAAVRTRGDSNINVRRYPDPEAYVMTTLQPTEIAIADGRTEDGRWLHVRMLETGETGWVSSNTVDAVGNTDPLRIVDALSADFGPMQAFYLNTGENGANCQDAPENGVLIQTPEGVATVDLWINEVKIRLGSTAYIQARPNQDMVIQMVEGATEVEALGVDQVAIAGTEITIAMNNQLQPQAPPSLPVAYDQQAVAAIPVAVLERPIEVAPPLDQATLSVLVDANRADAETPTSAAPTLTATSPPTNTSVPTLIPTFTQVPPTQTPTAVPPTFTYTPLPPTATQLPTHPPTATNTPLPPASPTEAATSEGHTFGGAPPGVGGAPQLPTQQGLPTDAPLPSPTAGA